MPHTETNNHAKIAQNALELVIQNEAPLHDKNWFRTGGNAKFFCVPQTAQEFCEALSFAQENSLNIFVLGKGANVVISDNGFDGLVIKPALHNIRMVDPRQHIEHNNEENNFIFIEAGAGASIQDLIDFCLENDGTGLEEFSGIPGTVGGAVFINIHYFEFFLGQFLTRATIIEKTTGKISTVGADWFGFGYNNSALHQQTHFLVSATFRLKKATPLETAYARGRRDEIMRHRTKRYPTSHTCGSFFRNFTPQEVAHTKNQIPFVAYYLDKLGIKGSLQYGDAKISYQHANMIVNQGNAMTHDIITLARMIQEKAKKTFNLVPQPECRLIGFTANPLLP